MPLLLIPLVLVLFFGVLVLTMPISLVLRYRAGTARRLGRKWMATLNLVMLALSVALFLWAAAITGLWVRDAFIYSVAGVTGGGLLGLLGLVLTRWEKTPQTLYYTPNRWLILIVTLTATTRLLYGFWRIWHAWRTAEPDTSWIASAGVAGSMAVGAIVLGYYLTYSLGVRWRLQEIA